MVAMPKIIVQLVNKDNTCDKLMVKVDDIMPCGIFRYGNKFYNHLSNTGRTVTFVETDVFDTYDKEYEVLK